MLIDFIAQIPQLVPSIVAFLAVLAAWKFTRSAAGAPTRRKVTLWAGCLALVLVAIGALGVESVLASDQLIDYGLMPSWGFDFLSWLTDRPISAPDVQVE